MAWWTSLIAPVAGALLGRSSSGGGEQNPYYRDSYKRAMQLYDTTNFEEIDRQAMDIISREGSQFGMQLLGNYDAAATSAGSPMWKDDSRKDSQRAQIARAVSSDVAGRKADLLLSRAQRKRDLLPGLNQSAYTGAVRPPSSNLGAISSLVQDLFNQGGGGGNGGGNSQNVGNNIVGYNNDGTPIYSGPYGNVSRM